MTNSNARREIRGPAGREERAGRQCFDWVFARSAGIPAPPRTGPAARNGESGGKSGVGVEQPVAGEHAQGFGFGLPAFALGVGLPIARAIVAMLTGGKLTIL